MYKILENTIIAKNTYKMLLEGNTSQIKNPGQFVNIKLDGLFLRRPISICDYDGNTITLIYKVVGDGTEKMSLIRKGERLNLICGLGNGFNTGKSGNTPLLIGGGVGLPPMLALCRKLLNEGKSPKVIAGFNTADDVFLGDDFKALPVPVITATVDGSYGIRGVVTDAMDLNYTYFYACGPVPMLKAVCQISKTSGQVSLEERMGCGFGVCMGCSHQTVKGSKRICKEGPVFEKEEIVW